MAQTALALACAVVATARALARSNARRAVSRG